MYFTPSLIQPTFLVGLNIIRLNRNAMQVQLFGQCNNEDEDIGRFRAVVNSFKHYTENNNIKFNNLADENGCFSTYTHNLPIASTNYANLLSTFEDILQGTNLVAGYSLINPLDILNRS